MNLISFSSHILCYSISFFIQTQPSFDSRPSAHFVPSCENNFLSAPAVHFIPSLNGTYVYGRACMRDSSPQSTQAGPCKQHPGPADFSPYIMFRLCSVSCSLILLKNVLEVQLHTNKLTCQVKSRQKGAGFTGLAKQSCEKN